MQFANAMGSLARTLAWVPEMGKIALIQPWRSLKLVPVQTNMTEVRFPLQRGYARDMVEDLARPSRRILKQLLSQSEDASRSALVCTSPFWAPVAEKWPGPIIYYVTDLTIAYAGLNPDQVRLLDRRLCRVATLVCPNSSRIADYLVTESACPPDKIVLIPNATNISHVRRTFSDRADPFPPELAKLPRPVAGVIGNLASNVDWPLVLDAMNKTPRYSWLFVGPYSMDIPNPVQRAARTKVMKHERAAFVGLKPYDELHHYARSLDVAVLPYRKIEPTYSGSATRFYEHLAACRPMLATRGVEELHHKEPFLSLVDTADQLAAKMNMLLQEPQDGFEKSRWTASQCQTWQTRASTMITALDKIYLQEPSRSEERTHA